jgi:hypothetical protein
MKKQTTGKDLPSDDPRTPMKYRPIHYDDNDKQTKFGMPTPPLNQNKAIPLDTRIWLNVFDDDPIGAPFRHEERST